MPTFKDEHRFFPNARCECVTFLEEVRPGIIHTSYLIQGFPFAKQLDWYAIVEPGERAVFIDTGAWELVGTEMLDELVARYAIPWANVEIAMTHFHVDHEESLQYCLARGAKRVYCGPCTNMTAASIRQFGIQSGATRADDPAVVELCISVGARLSETSIPHEEIVLSETDSLNIAGYTFRPIFTPGHTGDHVCYFETSERFLFGGDHIIRHQPDIYQWATGKHNLRDYLDTFPRLLALKPTAVYMAHFAPFMSYEETAECIDALLASYEPALAKVLEILDAAEHPLTPYEAAEEFYDHKLDTFIDDLRCRKVAKLFGYLEYLVDTGEAQVRIARDGACEYSVLS